jgi:hypothetical protein
MKRLDEVLPGLSTTEGRIRASLHPTLVALSTALMALGGLSVWAKLGVTSQDVNIVLTLLVAVIGVVGWRLDAKLRRYVVEAVDGPPPKKVDLDDTPVDGVEHR